MAKPVSKEVKALMSLLVYAKSEEDYEDSKGAMLQLVTTLIILQEYAEEQYIAEFNRLVTTLIILQEYAEEQYIAEFNRLSVRSHAVDEDIPVVKSIPQMNKIMKAIEAIKIRDDNDLLAYWPDNGFAMFDQLDGMASVIEARNHFTLVMRTMRWIDDVEWRVSDIRKPFSYARSVTKVLATQTGVEAGNPQYQRVIGIVNVGNHWVAFLVDRHIQLKTNKGVCFVFDPLQSQHSYTIVERSVRSAIEGLLHMEDMLNFEKVECCKQKDGSSCGVWCIAIPEILLSGASWDNCLYNLLPYLRMRFLYNVV
ncbi:hypothetical protein PInf_006725 [Phytophthora infestans]|nr:hypothetical protein PInf_006725 [Phytophthora infestans]